MEKKKINKATALKNKEVATIMDAIKVCAVIHELSEEDDDWCEFIAELLVEMKLKTLPMDKIEMKLTNELSEHLETLQLSEKDRIQFIKELLENLEIVGVIGKQDIKTNVNKKEKGDIVVTPTLQNIERIFTKELSRRRFPLVKESVSPKILGCEHEFIHEISCGEKCLVCDFETTKVTWNCAKGCDIVLCGSCSFKWKHRMPSQFVI